MLFRSKGPPCASRAAWPSPHSHSSPPPRSSRAGAPPTRRTPATPAAGAQGASASADITGEITVFAAASLQDAFEKLAASFQDAHPGARIAFDFQGSQDLVTALDGGSPADVLATANNSTMTDAANKGLVGEQTEFATNVLTLIVPAGNPAGVTGINDGSLDKADLVICAPEVRREIGRASCRERV